MVEGTYTQVFLYKPQWPKENVYTSHIYIFGSLTSESLYTPKKKKKKNHNCLGGKLLMVRKKVISVMGLDENQ